VTDSPTPETEAETKPARKGRPPRAGEVLGALDMASAAATEKKPRKAKAETPATEKKPARAKAVKPEEPRSKPLNFRVAPEFRKAFRRAAAAQDCKKVELLEKIFAEWSERNPG
jgi:predicted HicB family RNase H-like nuclease